MVDQCVSFGMTDYSNSNDCSFTGAESWSIVIGV